MENFSNMKLASSQPEPFSSEEIVGSRYISRGKRLLNTALCFMAENGPEKYQNREIVREEVAAGASPYLHRGYYCPSPVLDLIVGNYRRGKLLKKPNTRSRISHQYFYDNGGLFMVQRPYNVTQGYAKEYLLRSENTIIGVSIGFPESLEMVSEEIYEGDKLTEYFWVTCQKSAKEYHLSRGGYEVYYYDEEGLTECEYHIIIFGRYPLIQSYRYRFVRQSGYLTSYIETSHPNTVYTFGGKRLSLPPYF